MSGKKRKKRTVAAFLAAVGGLGFCIWILLYRWTAEAEQDAHHTPLYQKENLASYMGKKDLQEGDYVLLFYQTGLGPQAVDALWKKGLQGKLLGLQEGFFSRIEVECKPNTIVSRAESLAGRHQQGQQIPIVEKGDILINFNCHVFGWRSGHAGLVTDAENRLTLEARVLGTDTAILSLNQWEKYPSFAVLRLKGVARERRAEIADYAAENLTDIPYSLLAGLRHAEGGMWESGEYSAAGGIEENDILSGTQCAHLVWYAYRLFGYDLDSDGGKIVTPRDLYESPLLEIVQIYGMEPPEKP